METKIKKLIKDNLIVDKLIFKKDGTINAKQSYFYRHCKTPDKMTGKIIEELKSEGINIKILKAWDNCKKWPKTSCFEVNFKVV